MKKNYIILLLSGIVLLPAALQAQNPKEQQAAQLKVNASIEAKVNAKLTREKYNGDAALEENLYNEYYNRKLALEQTTSKYAQSLDLESRLTAILEKSDAVIESYVKAATNKTRQLNGNSKFAAAVRLQKVLNLDQAQIDSLTFYAMRLAELRAQPGFSPKEYERQKLPGLLSDQQYNQLLFNEHKDKAAQLTQTNWLELKERGLTQGLDSAATLKEIYNYNLGRRMVVDRYGDGSIKTIQLYPIEPKELKALRASKAYKNPVPAKELDVNFKW